MFSIVLRTVYDLFIYSFYNSFSFFSFCCCYMCCPFKENKFILPPKIIYILLLGLFKIPPNYLQFEFRVGTEKRPFLSFFFVACLPVIALHLSSYLFSFSFLNYHLDTHPVLLFLRQPKTCFTFMHVHANVCFALGNM